MSNFKAQSSVTIRRLRNGDTLYITLEAKPALFQAVDVSNGAVVPDWTITANQPVITPKCYASRNGITPKLSNHQWNYNGLDLVFGSSVDSEGYKVSTNDSRFKLNTATGALKITGNLASADNPANDTISYKAIATVDGVEYTIERSIDVVIHRAGESSYNGWITADNINLTSDIESATLTATLYHGLQEVADYYIEWTKYGDNSFIQKGTSSKTGSITINRDDVDDTAIFIAKFYENATAYDKDKNNPLCMATIRIDDIADEYEILFSQDNDGVSETQSVKVTATLYNVTKGSVANVDSPSWSMKVLHPENLSVLKPSATNTITVTTAETDTIDSDGNLVRHDVIVVAEVSF
ncbi:MAG: hypothetical protein ACI4UN_01505 [Muribaculaceae bacterium]